MSDLKNREGFWRSKLEPMLPMPIGQDTAWRGRRDFLVALEALEGANENNVIAYRGWSNCRLCNCDNGSVTRFAGNWMWPEGFSHYVEEHNVRPSLAFQEFVLGQRISN